MALSPSIPTSFVPKQPVSTGGKKYSSGSNILLIIALVIFGIAILAAAGVFGYLKYLESIEAKKGAQLVAAQNSVNVDTVDDFIRLRDRLTSAKTILNEHIQLSQFFTSLENVTLGNVRYKTLSIEVADDRSATLTLTGTAKDFNSLAAQSTAIAGQKYIKSAIFTGIGVDKPTGLVTFTINAELDPAIIVEGTAPTTPVVLPAGSASTQPVTSSLPAATTGTQTSGSASSTGTSVTPAGSAASAAQQQAAQTSATQAAGGNSGHPTSDIQQ